MKTLRSFVVGRWLEGKSGLTSLRDPSTEEEIARVSSEGLDFAEVVENARKVGVPALQRLSFVQRANLLKEMSKILRQNRQELLELSRRNNGTTEPDGAFDIDGASGTLAFYAHLGKGLGDCRVLIADSSVQLSKSGSFQACHLWIPRQGVALHINAFNFPAWGFAEKAACALLAGMPVITKPATATAMVTERWVQLVIEAGILPPGALQLVCGSAGSLVDHLGPHDVLAFTGSAETASMLGTSGRRQGVNTRFNIEADSLNAAVLGPDVALEGPTVDLFSRDVAREITQKSGQKCTAVRRILVPADKLAGIQEILSGRLHEVVTGNPAVESVSMGPLATSQQLAAAVTGTAALAQQAELVLGTGRRVDGIGVEPGKGYFFSPTLLRLREATASTVVHQLEVFAPVATLMPYDGKAATAAGIVGLAGGTLVTSLYSDDRTWVDEFLLHGGAATGRIYVGSQETAQEAPGSGVAMPQTLHGGPGRAGGGEELGGLIGVQLYMQRVALQGGAALIESLQTSFPTSS